MPQIEVTFDIDANGILNVSAKDKATGKSQNITITASSGLGKDEVERMVKEAQAHADEDKKRREVVDLRNQADTLAYSLEKLAEGEPREARRRTRPGEVEEAVAEAARRRRARTPQALRSAMDGSTRLSHKLAETLYKTARRPPGAGPGGGRGGPATSGRAGGTDDVVDAEYTVKE